MSIDSASISVIVQGPIDWTLDRRMGDGRTRAATRMIRHLLPDAEIIVSTWKDQLVDGVIHDKLVQSPDPGPQGELIGYTPSNVNRQIISTVAGLRQASRPLCIKIRSDMVLMGLDFIARWIEAEPLDPETSHFRRPVLANNLTSRDSTSVLAKHPDHPLLFHPSDHFHFGTHEDLLRLWDVPLQSEQDALFFVDMTQPNRWRYHELSRLTPEQYVLVTSLRKAMMVNIEHYADTSPRLFELSERIMQTHFVFMPDLAVPVHFEKYHTPHHFSFEWMRHAPMQFDASEAEPQSLLLPPLLTRRQQLWSDVSFPFRKPRAFRAWVVRQIAAQWERSRRKD